MNANFGDTLKIYLKETNILSKIIYISHESLVFDKGNFLLVAFCYSKKKIETTRKKQLILFM